MAEKLGAHDSQLIFPLLSTGAYLAWREILESTFVIDVDLIISNDN